MLKKEYDKLKKEKKAMIAREYQDLPIISNNTKEAIIPEAPGFFSNGVLWTSAIISALLLLMIL